MKCVYLLVSETNPSQRYIGITENLEQRIVEHNSGKSPHTSKHKPWKIVAAISFQEDQRAMDFEKYLKSGSGRKCSWSGSGLNAGFAVLGSFAPEIQAPRIIIQIRNPQLLEFPASESAA